jgi:hypothetical protein
MSHHSHLVTIRLWQEELGSGRSEWRGQLQLVASGETRYFRDWAALVAHLDEMLVEFDEIETIENLKRDGNLSGE